MNDDNKESLDESIGQLLILAEGFDKSWSFTDQGVEERALLFLPANTTALNLLFTIAQNRGLNADAVAAYSTLANAADAFGLTLGDTGSVRLYLQFWDRMAARVQAGDLNPAPLYIGIKAFPDGTMRTDTYYCQPIAPESEYRPVLEQALADFGCDMEAVRRMLEPLTPEACIWTRTQGDGRTSWLATLRRADITPADMIAALAPVAARPGVDAVIDALGQGAPLHIAGGEDRQKGGFLTFYVETDRAGAELFFRKIAALSQDA